MPSCLSCKILHSSLTFCPAGCYTYKQTTGRHTQTHRQQDVCMMLCTQTTGCLQDAIHTERQHDINPNTPTDHKSSAGYYTHKQTSRVLQDTIDTNRLQEFCRILYTPTDHKSSAGYYTHKKTSRFLQDTIHTKRPQEFCRILYTQTDHKSSAGYYAHQQTTRVLQDTIHTNRPHEFCRILYTETDHRMSHTNKQTT